jgi:mannose-6-phosphate isomerase-like protein (cupin superfamily)
MEIVDKPWGKEYWIEVNEHYAMKKLVIEKEHGISLQYHEKKTETMYVVKGIGIITIGGKWVLATPGTHIHIEPGTIHKVDAIEDMEIIEASTTELNDVVRL